MQIGINTVSSGNTYALNNGYIVEQAQLVPADTLPGQWERMFNNTAEELHALQRYYEKSYDITVDPGTVNSNGVSIEFAAATGSGAILGIPFKATKRAAPTVVGYSPNTGTSGKIFNATGTADVSITSTSGNTGLNGFSVNWSFTTGVDYWLQWTADAEI